MQPLQDICIVCQQGPTDSAPLVKPCGRCSVHLHERCLKLMINLTVKDRSNSKRINPGRWLLWLFDYKKFQQQQHPSPSAYAGSIVVHDRRSLTCGFVNSRIKYVPSILDMLILINMKPNDSFFIVCPNCRGYIHVFGRKPFLSPMNKIINIFKSVALASASASVVLGISVFTLFSLAATFTFNLDWASDFFRQTEELELTELGRFIMVPHFVYTMVTPNVGLLQLALASIYSSFMYGIPASGITAILQKFINIKLTATLIYRLTINRYYYESFKRTIPAVFGFKLSVEDALAIQDYRNETAEEDYYNLPLWKKCLIWVKDTWFCLWKDFGDLYRISSWDLVFGNYGFISTFFVGMIIAESPLHGMLYNIYLTESQNRALSKFAGIAITQLIYFSISTFDSCALARSYKSLRPGDGYLGVSKVKQAAAIVFQDFDIVRLGF